MSGHAKMPSASHQVSATSLKLLIQQIHPHVRVERDSGMCVARDLYELWGRSPYTRMFVARTSHQRAILPLYHYYYTYYTYGHRDPLNRNPWQDFYF